MITIYIYTFFIFFSIMVYRVKVKVIQSCPTLCEPMNYVNLWNSPGQNTRVGSHSLLQGIFPNQGSNPGLPDCRWILSAVLQGKPKNTRMGSLSLLQQIFSTRELNRGLQHCRRILYQLSCQEIPWFTIVY